MASLLSSPAPLASSEQIKQTLLSACAPSLCHKQNKGSSFLTEFFVCFTCSECGAVFTGCRSSGLQSSHPAPLFRGSQLPREAHASLSGLHQGGARRRSVSLQRNEKRLRILILISLHFSGCCSALFGLNISGSVVSHDFLNDPRVRLAEDLETASISLVQSDRPQTRGKTVAVTPLHIAYATKGKQNKQPFLRT